VASLTISLAVKVKVENRRSGQPISTANGWSRRHAEHSDACLVRRVCNKRETFAYRPAPRASDAAPPAASAGGIARANTSTARSLHTLRADIIYGQVHCRHAYGVIASRFGFTVVLYRGTKRPRRTRPQGPAPSASGNGLLNSVIGYDQLPRCLMALMPAPRQMGANNKRGIIHMQCLLAQ